MKGNFYRPEPELVGTLREQTRMAAGLREEILGIIFSNDQLAELRRQRAELDLVLDAYTTEEVEALGGTDFHWPEYSASELDCAETGIDILYKRMFGRIGRYGLTLVDIDFIGLNDVRIHSSNNNTGNLTISPVDEFLLIRKWNVSDEPAHESGRDTLRSLTKKDYKTAEIAVDKLGLANIAIQEVVRKPPKELARVILSDRAG